VQEQLSRAEQLLLRPHCAPCVLMVAYGRLAPVWCCGLNIYSCLGKEHWVTFCNSSAVSPKAHGDSQESHPHPNQPTNVRAPTGLESSILIHQCQQHHKICVWAERQPLTLQPRVSPSCASSTTHQASNKHHVPAAFKPLHPLLSLSALSLSLLLFFSILEKGQTLTLRQNSSCGSGSHRNRCWVPVARRGQPARALGKWCVGSGPCLLLPFASQPPASGLHLPGELSRWRKSQTPLLSSPLP